MTTSMSRLSKNKRTRHNERNDNAVTGMLSSVQPPLLEVQTQLWTARARAKQKWLEQGLAQPTTTAEHAALRMTWIKQALAMVKRGQAEIKHHAALMDAYAEHLSVLEMTLMAAAEHNRTDPITTPP